ncbi:ribosomal RNA small subunit methyltransferase A [Candidatus Marinamargulisbacteria bacterium SCGC AG-410-N11]|nr:ribosomal RNA small subunit methyltransferase A [Candidatus Marinamargulisbacteria bacterium SCGC AG-410-N11]
MKKPKLGQVFLTDHNILNKIINCSEISEDDTVVEIGCGDGILSKAIAARAKKLIIIEIDPECIQRTQSALKGMDNVRFINQDIRNINYSDFLSIPCKLIANIPYYLSSQIIKQLIAHKSLFKYAILMVQKEFALKIIASPGQSLYTPLTIFSHVFLNPSLLFHVSKNCFSPKPKVDSSIIKLVPREKTLYHLTQHSPFFKIVKGLFWGRRKTILVALKKNPYISLKKDFQNLSIIDDIGRKRGETLSTKELFTLFEHIKPFIIID